MKKSGIGQGDPSRKNDLEKSETVRNCRFVLLIGLYEVPPKITYTPNCTLY